MSVVDVEAALRMGRSSRRRAGEVPYPLDYTKEMINYDNWDQMFRQKCCRSLTMCQFDKPPSTILDIGCGGGYWCLEAAKEWPKSEITGFDLKDIQPNLAKVDSDLAQRVKWIHGNLLDWLPFSSNHFEYVRICQIGLGVPEDEWQFVLEEVARVMKPNAFLEVIEDDLIFPCSETLPTKRIYPPHPSIDIPQYDSSGLSIHSSTQSSLAGYPGLSTTGGSCTPTSDGPGAATRKLSLGTLYESPTTSYAPTLPPIKPQSAPLTITKSTFAPRQSQDLPSKNHEEDIFDPQDHSKLKAAWDGMLANRFLAPKLLTVLPFYLSSTFVDVQTHPALQIALPPNSAGPGDTPNTSATRESFENEELFDFGAQSSIHSGGADSASVYSTKSQRGAVSWAPMHLARTVQTILECKEALWVEYERLFGMEKSMPSVIQITSARGKTFRKMPKQVSVRDDFDWAWSNWHADMMDRISIRTAVKTQLFMPEPIPDIARPAWRLWRETLNSGHRREISTESPKLCRSLRSFVCHKPA